MAERFEELLAQPPSGHPPLEIELKYRTLEPPLCWEEIFGNTQPVSVEIGFGKCGFLLAMAAACQNVNFLGIESARKYYRKGSRKVARAGLSNVKLVLGEARHLFQRYFPDTSIQGVFVNFPDPWPKRRHAKRRLFHPAFLNVLAQKLVPSGCVEIATDDAAYSAQISEVFQSDARYMQQYYQTRQYQQAPLRPYVSEYEDLFLEQGKKIHYFQYCRV